MAATDKSRTTTVAIPGSRVVATLGLAAGFLALAAGTGLADPPAGGTVPGIGEIRVGAFYHDIPGLWSGFSVERPGPDLNLEVLFQPWARTFGGYLKPAIGATVNFQGDTSKAYADLRWEVDTSSGFFAGIGIGAAIHNGETDLVADERKALGSRILFHPSVEVGYRLASGTSVSVFADHVSNGYSQRRNEGMDSIGLRLGQRLAAPDVHPDDDRPDAVFTGFYIGAAAGARRVTSEWDTGTTSSGHRDAADVSGYAGHAWQSGRGVFGVEADAASFRHAIAVPCGPAGLTCRSDGDALYSLRARFGWTFDRTLIYATAGVAIASWDAAATAAFSPTPLAGAQTTSFGVALGLGIEQMLSRHLALRAEVMHYGLRSEDLAAPGFGWATNHVQAISSRVGLSWYFH